MAAPAATPLATDRAAADARLAIALLAVDPAGLGGVWLRAPAGPVRDAWLALLRGLLPEGTPLRRMPSHIGDDRLLGGLDLGATLQARRPVRQAGLLQEAAGGLVLLALAERLPAATAGRIAAVLDASSGRDAAAAVGVVALDEGEADEAPPAALTERLALHLVLRTVQAQPLDPQRLQAARAALPRLPFDEDVATALGAAAVALGIRSARVGWLAWRAACAAAAWAGHAEVSTEDAALAARLVLGPRARQQPAGPPPDEADAPQHDGDALPADAPPPAGRADAPEHAPDAAARPPSGSPGAPPPAAPEGGDASSGPAAPPSAGTPLHQQVLAAAATALPPGLLIGLAARAGQRPPGTAASAGRSGAAQRHRLQGRPLGLVRGEARGGRLDLIETLRAAAPWQPLRRAEALRCGGPVGAQVLVRAQDFRLRRYQQRQQTTTVFTVDASGSLALHRLAEAKGAVELLLADCYVRRDQVALIAFRGTGAQLLLPPTRSLVRAKRCLAELPGGGGTPLAAGIDAARRLAEGLQRQGGSVLVVLMTDARANIARDGAPGRERAAADALASARALQATGLASLMIDTGREPQPAARGLARAMGARYLALPQADAGRLWRAVAPGTAR
ncbi:magnesium chelatase subunit D [Aquincola tertiaricarbonis]|uniref:magnesium chelatase subunit D n=1 Tax=Aquincola tertiaricarbonis TaxID=391953 RepID=UPI0006152590|nr:magnesium chelatase subunit D [Aquincola tertiaricarbonis]